MERCPGCNVIIANSDRHVCDVCISVGILVLVQPYGDDPAWYEVVSVGDDVVCTNGHGENFIVDRGDIYDVTDDDSVLM